jgi:hypothetical protein
MGLAPNIPLSVNPPQPQPGPLDMAQKGLNVQALINAVQQQKTQQAAQQLELQQEQIKTQQAQQQFQDSQTIREMAPKYAGKDANGNGTFDFNGLATDAQARGVNPQMINQMRMQNYQMQEAAAKAGTESLANEQAHNKAAYEVLEGVKGVADPDERQTAYATGLNKLRLLGMDTSHLPPSAPDDKGLEAYETQLGMHGQLIADAKTLADTNKANAEASEKDWQKFPELGTLVNTKTGEVRNVAGNVQTPAMQESKYLAVQQKKNLGQPLSAEENAFSKSYEKMKELVPQYTNLMQVTGGGMGPSAGGPTPPALPGGPTPQAKAAAPGGFVSADGKTLNDVPGPIRDLVQKVLEYRGADPSLTQRGLMGAAINQWVAKLDPEHDSYDYPTRADAVKKFSNDANNGQLGSINTALGHLGELQTAAKTLDGSNLPLLHSLQARLGMATGDDAASTYRMILHRVGPEMTSAYVKGGGGQAERGANEEDFDISKGQKQILSNIAESAQLLNSKLDSKRQAWTTSFQPSQDKDQFDNRFITPAAKQVLTSLSANAPTNRGGANQNKNTIDVVDPRGVTHHFSDQASADKFKALAGIK